MYVGTTESSRRGPPNRMNDLVYRDWMKFQKSFFRYAGTAALAEEWLRFFTKAVWPDGRRSRSLLVGIEQPIDAGQREIEVCSRPRSLEEVAACLESREGRFDFILLDLRPYLTDRTCVTDFLNS